MCEDKFRAHRRRDRWRIGLAIVAVASQAIVLGAHALGMG